MSENVVDLEYSRRAVAGSPRIGPQGRKGNRFTAETVAAVIARLKAGEYRCDVARALRISEYGVTMIAREHGVTYAVCPRGSRWGGLTRGKKAPEKSAEPEKNWRAIASSLRWNCRGAVPYE